MTKIPQTGKNITGCVDDIVSKRVLATWTAFGKLFIALSLVLRVTI